MEKLNMSTRINTGKLKMNIKELLIIFKEK